MTGYVINLSGQPYIRCLRCGLISYHRDDIAVRYCGHCHVFHDAAENPREEQSTGG
jgi:ribosomal protein L37E